MKKLLMVRAHPLDASVSRSMQMADKFLEAYTQANPNDLIQDLHLYDVSVPEIDLDLLNGWQQLREGVPFAHLHTEEQNKITLFNNYTMQFVSSDKVVVVNPLWNMNVPTRLKAWLDTISVAGATFRYTPEGQAEGLVHEKRVLHLQASGGHFDSKDPACEYIKAMFNFLGVAYFETLTAEGMDHEPERADEIMAEALERVVEAAQRF